MLFPHPGAPGTTLQALQGTKFQVAFGIMRSIALAASTHQI